MLGAFLLLMLSCWVFILVVIGYVLQFHYPVFFFQDRIGKDGRIFRMIKFRTLKTSPGTLQQRRFRWGDFLRATSLDELPQLIHVLKGDMSFVGPRPLPVAYLALFSETQFKRHQVRPGITGWAQVNGRNSVSWKQKFDLDLYYIHHISFRFDMKIFIKTILLILSFKKDRSLLEEEFKGN